MAKFNILVWGECSEVIEVVAKTPTEALKEIKEHGFNSGKIASFGSTQWEEIRGVEFFKEEV